MAITRWINVSMLKVVAVFILAGCAAADSDASQAGYAYQGNAGGTSGGSGVIGANSGNGAIAGAIPSGGTGSSAEAILDAGVDGACAAYVKEADQVEEKYTEQTKEIAPVALYFMLDQSGSMQEIPEDMPEMKFTTAENSVVTLVNDPASTNLDVALQYFPLLTGICETGEGYDTPEVPLGRLPSNATAISDSLDLHVLTSLIPTGRTPIEGALRGVTAFCSRFKADTVANPDGEDCVAVFVTDGQPTDCTVVDGPTLAAIAKDAYDQSQVMTYAIGMTGTDFTVLNQIAQAGNTDCTPNDPATYACDVTSGADAFNKALALIRQTVTKTITKTKTVTKALECEWNIPAPRENEKLDLKKVNVQFSPTSSNTDTQIIAMVDSSDVDSSDKCGGRQGWHYDTPDSPTRIVACEATCSAIKAAEKGKISIVLGCETVIIK